MYARYAKITLQTTFLANNIKSTDTDCFVHNKLRSCKFLGRLHIVCVILYLVITFIALKNNGICFAEKTKVVNKMAFWKVIDGHIFALFVYAVNPIILL